MGKKTIFWLSLISLVLFIVGCLVIVGASVLADSSTNSGAGEGYGFLAVFAVILFLLPAVVIGLIPWIGGLIRSAKMHSWGWFVVVLLLGSLGALIYGIAGPSDPHLAYASGAPVYGIASPSDPHLAYASGAPVGRNQLALVSFLVSLVYPVGSLLSAIPPVFDGLNSAVFRSIVLVPLQVSGGLLGTLGVPAMIAAVVTGHLALSRAKRYPPQQARRGLAITGLVIGYVSLLVFLGISALFIVTMLQTSQ